MSYITKNLMPDENIIFCTKKHLIIFIYPVIWTVFSFYASSYMHSNFVLKKLEWTPWLLALIFWSYVWLEYQFSEFAVTNKRVMMREGFFYRHSNEIRLSSISQVNVEQSLIGQMLGYGMVRINAFGAYDAFSTIDKPFIFQQFINKQIDKISSGAS